MTTYRFFRENWGKLRISPILVHEGTPLSLMRGMSIFGGGSIHFFTGMIQLARTTAGAAISAAEAKQEPASGWLDDHLESRKVLGGIRRDMTSGSPRPHEQTNKLLSSTRILSAKSRASSAVSVGNSLATSGALVRSNSRILTGGVSSVTRRVPSQPRSRYRRP